MYTYTNAKSTQLANKTGRIIFISIPMSKYVFTFTYIDVGVHKRQEHAIGKKNGSVGKYIETSYVLGSVAEFPALPPL